MGEIYISATRLVIVVKYANATGVHLYFEQRDDTLV